jgi:hypothetical protein
LVPLAGRTSKRVTLLASSRFFAFSWSMESWGPPCSHAIGMIVRNNYS